METEKLKEMIGYVANGNLIISGETSMKTIKEFFDNHCIDFMVVGSLALETCGIELKHELSDIDIEAICDIPEKELIFQAICESQENNYWQQREQYPEATGCEHKPYIFNFRGYKVNVWPVTKFTHKVFVYKNYVKYAGVMSVLRAKMKYGRSKDYKHLMDIIDSLVKLPN